jgi:RHS repeat-associated protein
MKRIFNVIPECFNRESNFAFALFSLLIIFHACDRVYGEPVPPTTVATYTPGQYVYQAPGIWVILFDGSRSHDNDGISGGQTPKWVWDFNYSGNFSADPKTTITQSTTTQAFYNPGTYTVAVVYYDDDGQAGNMVTLTVTIDLFHTYYYLKDHLGSVKMIVDAYGNVAGYNDYYPFGMTMPGRSGICGGADARYQFTGKERDVAETGYDYFGARYYDSWSGRWLQVDPMDSSFHGISPYVYCMNNPIGFIDLFGDSARVLLDKDNQNITFVNYGDGKHKDKNGKLVDDKSESQTWDVGTAVTKGRTEVEADENGKIADDLTPKAIKKSLSYGPGDWTYIATGRADSKAIHGGGLKLGDPEAYADYQPLTPTWGCQRMHNADLRELSKMIREYKSQHPGEKIPEYEEK